MQSVAWSLVTIRAVANARRTPLLAALAAVTSVALGGLLFVVLQPAQQNAAAGARPGAPAPQIALATLDGGTSDLAAERGKVVLVNFWATWCEPCKSEMPALQRLADELRGQPFRLYSIDLQEDRETIDAFQRELGLNLYVLLDDQASVTRTYGVRGLPATFLIDRLGVVRVQRLGPLLAGGPDTTWSEPWLAEQVRSLLASS
jgi:thiol-disulfide isomerase/thioredoxin